MNYLLSIKQTQNNLNEMRDYLNIMDITWNFKIDTKLSTLEDEKWY